VGEKAGLSLSTFSIFIFSNPLIFPTSFHRKEKERTKSKPLCPSSALSF